MHARLQPVRKAAGPLWVNDTHSALNRTPVDRIVEPARAAEVADAVAAATRRGEPLAVCGARHAMGGQQFLSGGTLLDTRRLNQARWFDRSSALFEVEAGITWPDVIRGYLALQRGPGHAYGIRQKQTGADRLTLGGAVAANIHGRGLTARPFVDDIEGLRTPTGYFRDRRVSREHPALLRSVVEVIACGIDHRNQDDDCQKQRQKERTRSSRKSRRPELVHGLLLSRAQYSVRVAAERSSNDWPNSGGFGQKM